MCVATVPLQRNFKHRLGLWAQPWEIIHLDRVMKYHDIVWLPLIDPLVDLDIRGERIHQRYKGNDVCWRVRELYLRRMGRFINIALLMHRQKQNHHRQQKVILKYPRNEKLKMQQSKLPQLILLPKRRRRANQSTSILHQKQKQYSKKKYLIYYRKDRWGKRVDQVKYHVHYPRGVKYLAIGKVTCNLLEMQLDLWLVRVKLMYCKRELL